MSALPKGWIAAEIGSLCSLENGRAFKPNEWSTKGLPIVRIQNLNRPLAPYNYFEGEFADRYFLRGGELLFAWSGTPGTSFGAHVWRGGEAVLNQHIFRVDFNEAAIDKRFFRFAIDQKLNELINIAHGGVGLRHVTKGKFESTEIALAPLAEQKRIADKLDAVLARVDACRDRLDRIPAILKRFRQSILAAATSGKLTEDWRAENVARMQPQAESGNAVRDSAQSHYVVNITPDSATLHPGYEAALHSSVWQVGTLANLLAGKPRNGYSPRAVEYKTSVKSLTLTATTSGRFKGEHFKYIDEEISQESHLWLQPGDILIQRANTLESVGISAVYDGPPSTYIYPDLMMKAKANNLVVTQFLHYLLLSEPVRRHFRDNATGTAGNMPKINQPTVLSAPVTWPSLKEQTEIVRRAEALFACAYRLEARYTAARAQVEKLTPSTLAKAFRGELVPQDPNDEPASVLLERIRSKHNEQSANKPKRVRQSPQIKMIA